MIKFVQAWVDNYKGYKKFKKRSAELLIAEYGQKDAEKYLRIYLASVRIPFLVIICIYLLLR